MGKFFRRNLDFTEVWYNLTGSLGSQSDVQVSTGAYIRLQNDRKVSVASFKAPDVSSQSM